MGVPSFKTVMLAVAIVFACKRKTANMTAAENVLVSICSNQINTEYSLMAMTDTATLVDSIPNNLYNYHISNSYSVNGQSSSFWAHGACYGEIDATNCRGCLVEALYHLNYCLGKAGGQVKLTNCRLRYETYQFDWNW